MGVHLFHSKLGFLLDLQAYFSGILCRRKESLTQYQLIYRHYNLNQSQLNGKTIANKAGHLLDYYSNVKEN
jgi:hypothetical protein